MCPLLHKGMRMHTFGYRLCPCPKDECQCWNLTRLFMGYFWPYRPMLLCCLCLRLGLSACPCPALSIRLSVWCPVCLRGANLNLFELIPFFSLPSFHPYLYLSHPYLCMCCHCQRLPFMNIVMWTPSYHAFIHRGIDLTPSGNLTLKLALLSVLQAAACCLTDVLALLCQLCSVHNWV